MTERPFEDRSDVVKELYSELNVIKPHSGPGTIYCAFVLCKVDVELMYEFSLLHLGPYL